MISLFLFTTQTLLLMKKTVRSLSILFFLVSVPFFNSTAQTSCPIVPFAVVELFTSQGCSSCPNGDLLLSNLINQEANSGRNVICIAEHVTYWDNINANGGPWADQYGMSMFNARQDAYVTTSGVGVKGTPQLFVNGKTNVTSTSSLNNAVNNQLNSSTNATAGVCLTLQSSVNAPTLTVAYSLSGNYSGNNLIVCLTENDRTVTPTSGENAGRALHHDGVARVFTMVPITNATGTVTITPPANCIRAKSRIVAYIQAPITSSNSNSTIKGATKGLDLSNTTLGVENNTKTGLNIEVYPNPASGNMYVNYKNTATTNAITFNLSDLSGRLVHSENSTNMGEFTNTIDVSSFAKGIYILNVKAGNETINKKIIVE